MRVSLVEYAVFREPEGLEGWRCYRIEYLGTNREGSIWLPPDLNPSLVEDLINKQE
jgi:hypothetical protein